MTSPDNGGFDYTDDSVIARVSVDVPESALSDITKLSEAMAAMRNQLAAVADAQEKWLGFVGQMPDLIDGTNEAIQKQITLLERQSYLQSGGTFTGAAGAYAGGGGGGGPAGYSTAAAPGYGGGPWQGGTPGMGIGAATAMMGGGMNRAEVSERAASIAESNPGLEANIESARGDGGAVNPALAAAAGAGATAVARKFGLGKKDIGNASPQKTGGDRNSSAPPGKDGAPITSPDQNTPGDPNVNETDDVKRENLITQVLNEFKGGKDGRAMRIGGLLLSAAGRQVFNRGNGAGGPADPNDAAAGSGGGTSSGLLGGLGSMASSIIKSPAGMAAGGLGLGALAFNKVQDIGERVTDFQQLGSVQGGDYMTGMKYEAQARMMALNPFITTQQARQAMQMALKEGFRGDNYDTVNDFMISNFKELGISMGQSMELMKSQVKGMGENDSEKGVRKGLDQTLNTMKEMSKEGGLSLPERVNQMQQMSSELSAQGFGPEAINRAVLGTQEGLGDSMALRESAGRITTQTTGSSMLMTLAAQKAGVTGMLPNALPAALERAGLDPDEIRDMAASQIAGYVSGYPDPLNRIAGFQMLMGQYGVELTFPEAEALYNKVSGGKALPSQQANNKVARQGKTETGGSFAGRGGGRTSSSAADSDWTKNHPSYSPSENAAGVSENFDAAGRGGSNFAGTGRPPVPPPSSPQPGTVINSSGMVTGNVTITVDKNGNVTAPATIQLTGTQKSSYAGYGSSQLNNAPPGDPSYNHSWNSFPAPGGGG